MRDEFPEPNPVYWFTGDVDNFRHRPRSGDDALIFTEGAFWPLSLYTIAGVALGFITFMLIDTKAWRDPLFLLITIVVGTIILACLYRVSRILLRRKQLKIENAGVLTLSENWPRSYRIEAPIDAARIEIFQTHYHSGRNSWNGWALCLIIDDQWFVFAASRKGPEPLLEYAYQTLPMFKGKIKAPFYSVTAQMPF